MFIWNLCTQAELVSKYVCLVCCHASAHIMLINAQLLYNELYLEKAWSWVARYRHDKTFVCTSQELTIVLPTCSYLHQGMMTKRSTHAFKGVMHDDSIWMTNRQARSILNRHNLCESHVEYRHIVAHVLRECSAPQLVLAEDGPQPKSVGEAREHLLHINEAWGSGWGSALWLGHELAGELSPKIAKGVLHPHPQ